ncbi:uncharacterized protein LOC123902487 isoform X3 [Trifolium pratense]|uniref:uncharacterized protein LOC123902487 isoform X3 n=1 Tax=Trifolium pratense TaxID=57577 RepID=UPI001E690972|nr:uncharacterized protein LOC123902487 isoform X3 [Trifolium pratense]
MFRACSSLILSLSFLNSKDRTMSFSPSRYFLLLKRNFVDSILLQALQNAAYKADWYVLYIVFSMPQSTEVVHEVRLQF